MSKFSLFSLRSRAIILVLLAILPMLAWTLYAYFDQRGREIREVQREELVAVRNFASIQDTLINDTWKLLSILAQLPQVQRRDRDACNALFAELLKKSPHSLAIGATDAEGRLFASAPAVSRSVNYADRRWFQEVVRTRNLVIGQTFVSRISGKYGHNLAYPILDSQGRFQGALTIQLNLQWLGNLLAKSNFPPTTAIGLTDSTWKVLFHYPEPQKYNGKMFPDALIKAMTSSAEGVAAGVGLPGDERLFAFTRLAPPWEDIRLAVGLPQEWAVAPVNRTLLRNLLWLGLVTLFAIVAAWFGGDLFIVRPVQKLRAITDHLAAGDLTVRAGPRTKVGELGLLAHSLDQMADSLQEREQDLRRSADRLQLAIDAANAAAWEWDMRTSESFWSDEMWVLYDLQPHSQPPSYETWLQTVHPGDREKAEADTKMAFAQGIGFDIEWRVQLQEGGIRWLMSRGKPQFDDQGQLKGYLGISMDITARKAAEENIRYLTHELMRVQEQERHRVSLELHDTVAQELASLKIHLENLRDNSGAMLAEEIGSQLTNLFGMVQQSLNSIRTLSHNLRPPDLQHLGLVRAIQRYCEEVAGHTGLHIDFTAAGIEAIHLDYEAAINLYRIVQEALTNVGRHARAENVSIRLVASYPKIILRLEDDGQGFEVSEKEPSSHPDRRLGLLGMKERVAFLGGEMHLESLLRKGTKIKIEVPWSKAGHGLKEKDSYR
jgi:signal transduction histidine kinase/HAMP domain-containing protein